MTSSEVHLISASSQSKLKQDIEVYTASVSILHKYMRKTTWKVFTFEQETLQKCELKIQYSQPTNLQLDMSLLANWYMRTNVRIFFVPWKKFVTAGKYLLQPSEYVGIVYDLMLNHFLRNREQYLGTVRKNQLMSFSNDHYKKISSIFSKQATIWFL